MVDFIRHGSAVGGLETEIWSLVHETADRAGVVGRGMSELRALVSDWLRQAPETAIQGRSVDQEGVMIGIGLEIRPAFATRIAAAAAAIAIANARERIAARSLINPEE